MSKNDCDNKTKITITQTVPKEKIYFVGPCASFKKSFKICMSNSDGNVSECQNLKRDYENCIEQHFSKN